jgi:hypothetical protein
MTVRKFQCAVCNGNFLSANPPTYQGGMKPGDPRGVEVCDDCFEEIAKKNPELKKHRTSFIAADQEKIERLHQPHLCKGHETAKIQEMYAYVVVKPEAECVLASQLGGDQKIFMHPCRHAVEELSGLARHIALAAGVRVELRRFVPAETLETFDGGAH